MQDHASHPGLSPEVRHPGLLAVRGSSATGNRRCCAPEYDTAFSHRPRRNVTACNPSSSTGGKGRGVCTALDTRTQRCRADSVCPWRPTCSRCNEHDAAGNTSAGVVREASLWCRHRLLSALRPAVPSIRCVAAAVAVPGQQATGLSTKPPWSSSRACSCIRTFYEFWHLTNFLIFAEWLLICGSDMAAYHCPELSMFVCKCSRLTF